MRKISTKGLVKKLEHLQRDYLIKLRGGFCELCTTSPAVVADHCFSRQVRQLFFDTRNLSVLCDSCHFKKTYRIKGADLDIYALIQNREGLKAYNEMLEIARRHEPFPAFSKRSYLESVKEKLEFLIGEDEVKRA